MKNLTTLTPTEDAAWVNAFCFYSDSGMSDADADQAAWDDIQQQFPRLQEFDGIKEDNT